MVEEWRLGIGIELTEADGRCFLLREVMRAFSCGWIGLRLVVCGAVGDASDTGKDVLCEGEGLREACEEGKEGGGMCAVGEGCLGLSLSVERLEGLDMRVGR
jgi:hypothetical protein